jgi:hypothetical protein
MAITLTKALPPLPRDLLTRETMREMALLAREQILRRTAAGVDADGRPFAPYSPTYAKRKSEALGTTRVTLQVSGRMLGDLKVLDYGVTESGRGFARLGFTS